MRLSRPAFLLVFLSAVIVLAGCGGSKQQAPSGAPAGLSYSLSVGPITVPAGVENTQCVVLNLGNPTPIHVGSIHNTLSQSSHHMIVYRTNDTVEQTTPFDCFPFTDTLDPTKGSTLMVSQKKDDTLTLPPGVGFTIQANQMVRIELHYINAGSAPVQVQASTTFVSMADSAYQNEADFLFIGDPDIKLAPNAATTLGPIYFPLPSDYAGAQFFAITGHEHHLGTNVTVSTATGPTDTGTSVYDVPGWLWSEPTTVQSNPPFTVPSGGGFNFTCSWNNTTDATVKFGESANDEMCFFWAYYYPSQGPEVCVHTEQQGGHDLCCPGPNIYCDFIVNWLNNQDAGN
jgi:Copper type II ascorbate-dependent monooxygenase, C-terminal domain